MSEQVDSERVSAEIIDIRQRLRVIAKEMDERGLKVPSPDEQQLLDDKVELEKRMLELAESLVDPSGGEDSPHERKSLKNPPLVPPV